MTARDDLRAGVAAAMGRWAKKQQAATSKAKKPPVEARTVLELERRAGLVLVVRHEGAGDAARIDVRLWVLDEATAELRPTKSGLRLHLDELVHLEAALGEIRRAAR